MEQKVRVWDNVLEKMLYSKMEQMDDSILFRFEEHLETEEPIYSWYIGLNDKAGKPVFEGDILKLKDYHGERIVEVNFHNGFYYYGGDGFSDEYLINSRDREVIGNIYEHPHLLEGET